MCSLKQQKVLFCFHFFPNVRRKRLLVKGKKLQRLFYERGQSVLKSHLDSCGKAWLNHEPLCIIRHWLAGSAHVCLEHLYNFPEWRRWQMLETIHIRASPLSCPPARDSHRQTLSNDFSFSKVIHHKLSHFSWWRQHSFNLKKQLSRHLSEHSTGHSHSSKTIPEIR